MLREHRRRQAQQRPQAAVWDDNDLILGTHNGHPINPCNLSHVWRRVTERAGVEHRGIHHLRHTYGTTLAENGVHQRVAQQLLGDADSRTTREIYTHVSERMMDHAVQAIADAVDRVVGDASGSGLGPEMPATRNIVMTRCRTSELPLPTDRLSAQIGSAPRRVAQPRGDGSARPDVAHRGKASAFA